MMRLVGYTAALSLLLLDISAAGGAGGGQARIGYSIVDEEGNLGVNQESFNLYEGLTFSVDGFHYRTETGVDLLADFRNITLDNRDLRASILKPGVFRVSLKNQQYRRINSFDGNRFTRRGIVGGEAHLFVTRHVKLFGGFSSTDKRGDDLRLMSADGDSAFSPTDYTRTRFSVGSQVFYPHGSLTVQGGVTDFTDDGHADGSRQGKDVDITAFIPVPKYHRVVVSGGYHYREDRHDASSVELTVNQGWAAARAQLPYSMTAECRFTAARSDHSQRAAAVDNYISTASVGRQWVKYGGVRVGYENHVQDDVLNRTMAHAVLFSGWFRYDEDLLIRGGVTIRDKNVKEGITLVGEEQLTRYQLSVRYHVAEWGDVSGSYRGRTKSRDDIGTNAEYNSFSTEIALSREAYGKLTLSYAYNTGTYENRSSGNADDFSFDNHVVTGLVTPREYHKVQVSFGGTYYRSRHDLDTEKFGTQIQARYAFPDDIKVEVRYRALNFDDFLVTDRYYTGNIVDLYLIKGFDL